MWLDSEPHGHTAHAHSAAAVKEGLSPANESTTSGLMCVDAHGHTLQPQLSSGKSLNSGLIVHGQGSQPHPSDSIHVSVDVATWKERRM